MLILWLILAFIGGFIFGFVIVSMRITVKPSGILHIKQTEEKDYYTIEITDDFNEIPDRKQILLNVKTTR